MTFDWVEGAEPTALQITGVCPEGHAHFELLGDAGSAVAGGTITRNQCLALANLLLRTIDWIDDGTDAYVEHGITELERYVA